MPRKQFTFYRSFWDAIQEQPSKIKAELILAICAYALDDEEPKGLSPNAAMGFRLIRPVLDTGKRKSENGKKGGETKQNESKTEANVKQTATEKEVEIEKEKELEIEIEYECINKATKPPRTRFSPPSVEDVRSYCFERGNRVDPQRFVDYYESNGWMVGKNKMKDWKAAVRTWERSGDSKQKKTEPTSQDILEMIARGEFDD